MPMSRADSAFSVGAQLNKLGGAANISVDMGLKIEEADSEDEDEFDSSDSSEELDSEE